MEKLYFTVAGTKHHYGTMNMTKKPLRLRWRVWELWDMWQIVRIR